MKQRGRPCDYRIVSSHFHPICPLLLDDVHLRELPQLWLSTLRIPDEADSIFWLDAAKLPACWKSGTLGETQTLLTEWLQAPFCLAMAVPSVILEVSYNSLLHPQHASFAEVEVIRQPPIPLDTRLRK